MECCTSTPQFGLKAECRAEPRHHMPAEGKNTITWLIQGRQVDATSSALLEQEEKMHSAAKMQDFA
jgi:hypothetical protein